MQTSIKHRAVLVWLAGLGLFTAGTATAATSFNSSAALSYSIESIVNLSNPGDLSGLEIVGYFQQIDAPANPGDEYSQVQINGVGSVIANNPELSTSGDFNYTFAASGTLANGTLDAHHLGWYGLEFRNNGSDRYAINLRLDYLLSAAAGSATDSSSVAIDFFNGDGLWQGADRVDTAFNDLNVSRAGTSGLFGFELAAGQAEGLYADVRMDNHLEASPVPLPAAVWSFLAGVIGILGLKKRRSE
ncbi:hypothetical protein [Methylomonas koyamae]|uniref:hypothetical protein n=1 Tax=Methylomonas koyamae TaxID=702114 RepID=UPI00112B7CA7|nr:hypothetical protein [Methylomonas koyamae]TPQ29679.1 hypothetical protein C2U68_01275 [Methylomonas koyamae]